MLAKGRIQGKAKPGGRAPHEWEKGTFSVVKEINLKGLGELNAVQRKSALREKLV